MEVHLEYQGHWVKVKVMCKKMIIYLFQLVIPLYGHISRSNQGQYQIEVICKERYSYAGGLHLNQMRSCSMCSQTLMVFTTITARLYHS